MDNLFVSKNIAPLVACILGALCWAIVVYSRYVKKTENGQMKAEQDDDVGTIYDEAFHTVINVTLYLLGFTVVGLGVTLKIRGYFIAEIGFLLVVSLIWLVFLWQKKQQG